MIELRRRFKRRQLQIHGYRMTLTGAYGTAILADHIALFVIICNNFLQQGIR